MTSPPISHSPLPPSDPSETILVSTTDEIAEECPRFRILIVGRTGTGKSSLINAIFKASLANVQDNRAGDADIDKGITSEHNEYLILHDSQGYEPGSVKKFDILSKFIQERTRKDSSAGRLHAIWLCIPIPYAGGRIFEAGDEKIFQLNRNEVPIIIVFTKFDLFVANVGKGKAGVDKDRSLELAAKDFKERFRKPLKNIKGQISYTLVSVSMPKTLQQLVRITMRNLDVEMPVQLTGLARLITQFFNTATRDDGTLDVDLSDPVHIALAIAQRVDMSAKNAASIKVGEMTSGVPFLNVSLKNCLYAIHKDIVTVWNIRDLHKFLLSEEFHRRIMFIVDDLHNRDQMSSDNEQSRAWTVTGLTEWMNMAYQKPPEHIRCMMGYVVDLTLILQAVFQLSLEDQFEGKVTPDQVIDIVYEFDTSTKKRRIHEAIRAFVGSHYPFSMGNIVEKIELLLTTNEMKKDEIQLDKKRTLELLLSLVRNELTEGSSATPNQITLALLHSVLDLSDYSPIVSDLDIIDTEILFDFILYQARKGTLVAYSGMQDTNRKARRLMFDLISEKDVFPRSLFITGVKTSTDMIGAGTGMIGAGAFVRVYHGEYEGQRVALKQLCERQNESSDKDFLKEALAWRSLLHRYIMPLLGVFKEDSNLFFVSSYMENGTLWHWRRRNKPAMADVHGRMLEVAEAMEYIHAEGLVHGDLHGRNVLLDRDFHCQIIDFALTQHFDIPNSKFNTALRLSFAAPELFGACVQSDDPWCSEYHDGREPMRRRTAQADVYAFGCLYYATFFNTGPFEGQNEYQIARYVTRGDRPPRMESPTIGDDVWALIEHCWKHRPSERPTMQEVVETMKAWVVHD